MLTYNQIIKISRAFQQAHYGLKNFGNGQDYDEVLHNQQATYKYPLMWMVDNPSPYSEGIQSFSFRVVFMAPVVQLKEQGSDLLSSNVNEVKSDMIQCANDFIAYWIQQTDNYDTLGFDKTVNRETFEDWTVDRLTGCAIDIRFYQPFDYNECSIPMGTPTSLPDTCAPVLIYEDGVLVDTVASGGTYSYTSGGGGSTPVDVTVNGELVYNQVTTNQALTVIDQDNNQIGFLDAPNTWLIENSVVTVKNSAATIIDTVSVLAFGSAETTITDSTAVIKNSAGVTLKTESIPAETSENITINDCTQTMNGAAIQAQLPETAKTFVIRYANNDPVTVTTITDTATSFIGEVPDVVVPNNSATPFKDGQTTSYVTGDAGQYEDGEGVDFLTLTWTNDFGNTNRFTSENGDQTYTAGYVVDHASKNQNTGRIRVWRLGLESAVASTHLSGQPYTYGGLTGWKIPRLIDLYPILNHEQATTALNYAPFNINANSIANSLILQNTLNATTGYRFANSLILSSATLANTMRRICYRDCTLAEINTL